MPLTTKMIFCFENAADAATLAASSEASVDMAVENLQSNLRVDAVWRSVAAGTPGVEEYIEITLDDSDGVEPVSMLGIVDLNLPATGTVLIEAWEEGFDVGDPVLSIEKNVFGSASGFGVGGFGHSGFGGGADQALLSALRPVVLIYLEGWHTYKYWRVTLSDATATFVQASRLYLGGYWQPENNFAGGMKRELVSRTPLIESIGGQEYGDDRRSRVTISAMTKNLREEDADYLYTKFLEYGVTQPFLVSFRPTDRLEQLLTTLWVRFRTNTITQQSFDNYDADISVLEWL